MLKSFTSLFFKITTTLSFYILMIISGCQKEISIENGYSPAPPNVISDSIYLDKIYKIDVTNGANDTVEMWSYNYDNLKRVTSFKQNSTDPTDLTGYFYYYFYNNLDTLPYKTVSVIATSFGPDSTTRFHFWDASGRNLRDSSFSGSTAVDIAYICNYYYGANKVYDVQSAHYFTTGSVVIAGTDTATTDNNNNILNCKNYAYNSSGGLDLTSFTDYTYDNKRSPFSILSNFKTFHVFPHGETFYEEIPGFNNKTSQSETNSLTSGGPNTNNYTFSNLYNSSNQLKEVTISDISSAGTFITKLKFTYKAL